MTWLQAKTTAFVQFSGHNVHISCSKLLGVRKRIDKGYKETIILARIWTQIQNGFLCHIYVVIQNEALVMLFLRRYHTFYSVNFLSYGIYDNA